MTYRKLLRFGSLCALAAAALPAGAQTSAPGSPTDGRGTLLARMSRPAPHYTIPGPDELCRLYATGQEVALPTEEVWRFACGTDTTGLTAADLKALADESHQLFSDPANYSQVTRRTRGPGVTVIFNTTASVPDEAKAALVKVADVIAATWADPITITINFNYKILGDGILGSTSSNYITTPWPTVREGLKNGMDSDDTIQAWVPSGDTIPVRYNGASGTVTQETRVFVTKANTKATVGTTTGIDASMTFSSVYDWDYEPSDGVRRFASSFVDVIIHEVGHAMGFVSGADFRAGDMEMIDVFRFQRTDGAGDYNPDTLGEFQSLARLVDKNVPDDDHNSDFIGVEYRMSDGNPWQASHWREQSPSIGIMDPAYSGGTLYPTYYKQADLDMFDAIGYDRSSCATSITDQPDSATSCEGDSVTFTVAASGSGLGYQWRKDGGTITGAVSPSYTLDGVAFADTGVYDCVVSSSCGSVTSNGATLTVYSEASIYDQPDSITRAPGESATFTVGALGSPDPVYQWRKNTVPIDGATSPVYTLASVTADDAGDYDVYVINECATVLSAAAHLTVSGGEECKPDCNKDGKLNINDFICMKSAFDGKTPYGDYNGDAKWDIKDWIAFQSDFVKGCP